MPTEGIVTDTTIDNFAKSSIALKGERYYNTRRVVEFEFDSRTLECKGAVLASFDKQEVGGIGKRLVNIRLTRSDPAKVEFSHCSCANGLIDCAHKDAMLCYLRDNISKTDLRNVKLVDQPTRWQNVNVATLFPISEKFKCNISDEDKKKAREILIKTLCDSANPKPFLFQVCL